MTMWDDRFKGHPVFNELKTLEETLAAARPAAEGEVGPIIEVSERLDRITAVLGWTRRTLSIADPLLVAQSTLAGIQGLLATANQKVSAFATNQDLTFLDSANSSMDSMPTLLQQLPRLETPSDVQDVADAVSTFRRSMAQHARNLSKEVGALKSEIEETKSAAAKIHSEIEEHGKGLGTTIAGFQTSTEAEAEKVQELIDEQRKKSDVAVIEVHEHAEEELSKLRTHIEEQRPRLDNAIAQFQDQFSKSEDGRRAENAKLNEEFRTNYRTRLDEDQKKQEETVKRITTAEEKALERLRGHENEAERIVTAIGSAGMTTGYRKQANARRLERLAWQLIVGGSLLGFTYFNFVYILPIVQSGQPIEALALKGSLALGLVVLFTYAAAQARRAQRLEEQYRSMELQLASLGPFVANLPQQNRDRITEEAVKRFFLGAHGPPAPVEREHILDSVRSKT